MVADCCHKEIGNSWDYRSVEIQAQFSPRCNFLVRAVSPKQLGLREISRTMGCAPAWQS